MQMRMQKTKICFLSSIKNVSEHQARIPIMLNF